MPKRKFKSNINCIGGQRCEWCKTHPDWRKRVGAPEGCLGLCEHARARETGTEKIDGEKQSCCTRAKVRYRFDEKFCPDCEETFWEIGELVSNTMVAVVGTHPLGVSGFPVAPATTTLERAE